MPVRLPTRTATSDVVPLKNVERELGRRLRAIEPAIHVAQQLDPGDRDAEGEEHHALDQDARSAGRPAQQPPHQPHERDEQHRRDDEARRDERDGLEVHVDAIQVVLEERARRVREDRPRERFHGHHAQAVRVGRERERGAHLREGAVILNTGSVTALKGNKGLIDYAATKGAIHVFTKSLAMSLGDKGIRVNCVAPGPVWTPLIPASFDKGHIEKFGKDTLWERPAQPAEIAPSYVFLASVDGRYYSGDVLAPTGEETTR